MSALPGGIYKIADYKRWKFTKLAPKRTSFLLTIVWLGGLKILMGNWVKV